MEPALLMIDGGSTNTRFTLWRKDEIAERTQRRAGASSGKQSVVQAVRQEIGALERKWNCKITEIYASGMITSESGLALIPHIEGPAGLDDFARSVVTRRLPEISPAEFSFVPGVKFGTHERAGADLVRGEEVELLGAIEPGSEEKNRLFLHFGSHNKLLTYRDGMIQSSITTLSGELLWAVWQNTILKKTLGEQASFELDKEYVLRGWRAARELGLTRALFSARTMDVIEHVASDNIWSYVYGAIFAEDLRAFEKTLDDVSGEVVLYGRDEFIRTAEICLDCYRSKNAHSIRTIPHEESEWLSVRGMQRIRQRRLELCRETGKTVDTCHESGAEVF